MVVEQPQRNGIDRAVGHAMEGSSEIVEPVVAVHRGDNGDVDPALQNRTDHVCARAMAVDDLKAFGADHVR